MKIAILGFGAEGKSLYRYLKSSLGYRGATIAVLDQKLNKNYLADLAKFDLIFRSPGIPYLRPEIQQAKKSGVKISSATQLFFEQLRGLTRTARGLTRKKGEVIVIGVTGTKGKGTTSSILYQILKTAGKKVFLAGNIGTPTLEILPKLTRNSVAILELSSFQLQDLTHSPAISIVLDISPDHLDYHKNPAEYTSAKSAIAKFQTKNDWVVFSKQNPVCAKIARLSHGQKIGFSLKDTDPLLAKIKKIIPLPGEHNLKNAYAASQAAKILGIKDADILKAIKKFQGLEYRLQLIKKNPRVYNDSASTNPETAIAGIKAVKPTILIMGGLNKNLSYKNLPPVIKNSGIQKIFLFGQNRRELNRVLKNTGSEIKIFPGLTKLIKQLKNSAVKSDTILFSPGSASFDQFKNYKDRGKTFNKLLIASR